ncbi:MAG: hypothetical protein HQL51_04510 [Magnetococcales bacterium]|nr:hypothetical protein [Magnetococcales bacterium]
MGGLNGRRTPGWSAMAGRAAMAAMAAWLTAATPLHALAAEAKGEAKGNNGKADAAAGESKGAAQPAGESAKPADSRPVDLVDPLKDPFQLLESLEKKRLELDERIRWLELRENELKLLEVKIDKRIKALEELRQAIEKDLTKEKDLDDANIAKLAKIYSGMKPRAAGEQLQELTKPTAIKVLKTLSEKNAAKILNTMAPEKAVPLAQELGLPIADRRQRKQ